MFKMRFFYGGDPGSCGVKQLFYFSSSFWCNGCGSIKVAKGVRCQVKFLLCGRCWEWSPTGCIFHSQRCRSKPDRSESWAICRIFKKTNTSAQRALSHTWISSSFPETTDFDDKYSFPRSILNGTNYASENISCTTESASAIQFGCNVLDQHYNSMPNNYPSSLDFTTFKSINLTGGSSKSSEIITPASFMFSAAPELSTAIKPSVDVASMLLNLSPAMILDMEKGLSPSIYFDQQHDSNGFTVTNFPLETNGSLGTEEEDMIAKKAMSQWGNLRTMNFPFNLTSNIATDDQWKLNFSWESALCPSDISSTCYSSSKC